MDESEIDVGLEQALAAQLAAKRHKRSIPEDVWERWKSTPEFMAAVQDDPAAIRQLHASFGKHVRSEWLRRRRAAAQSRRAERALRLVPEEERKRAEVAAKHFARLARRLGERSTRIVGGKTLRRKAMVEEFRDRFLRGEAVSAACAGKILESPAVAFLPEGTFDLEQHLSLRDHEAEFLSSERGALPDGSIYEDVWLNIRRSGAPGCRWERERFAVPWPTNRQFGTLYILEKGRSVRRRVFPGTVLDRLGKLSDHLAQHYGWAPAEATWFVLTDEVPSTPCVQVEPVVVQAADHTHAVVMMAVQPWVSANTVAAVYRTLQQEILREVQKSRTDRLQIHPTRIKALEFFDYVSKVRSAGHSWRTIMNRWNATRPPAERYDGEDAVWNFERGYTQIETRIVHLQWPEHRVRERKKKNSRSIGTRR